MKSPSAGLMFILIIFTFLLSHHICTGGKSSKLTKENFMAQRQIHSMKVLTQKAAKRATIDTDYETFHKNYLQYILRVRVPGTVGHHEVKMFLINKLKEFGWVVQLDEFINDTPIKKIKFTNIMATLNPKANRRLALAAHYDSKLLEPKNGKYFVAATDSAVPCAMLLDLAKILADQYKQNPDALKDVTPMIVFLDGEEAFVDWTETDSIYGARHLSNVLADTPHNNKVLRNQGVNMLDSISTFVLFDLIGDSKTQFFDLFPSATSRLYNTMADTESKLRTEGKLKRGQKYFVGSPRSALYVEDDHLPFLKKGVPILHMISIPFPGVWHTLKDDESALDPNVISDLLILYRRVFLEFFQLSS